MRQFLVILILVSFYSERLSAQKVTVDSIHLLFYNTENLFDTVDDPTTLDEEFTPKGDRHWSNYRLAKKLNQLSKVILNSAGFEPPEIIGLCEIENRKVLEMLVQNTPIKNYSYSIIHKDSPDERGIDVALLFRSDFVKALDYHYLPLVNEKMEVQSTREILQAKFLLPGEDTLYVFFNHWPSRYRGQAETEDDRMLAAKTLKAAILKVQKINSAAKIIVMGDFNDQPQNKSLTTGLHAIKKDNPKKTNELINLSYSWKPGTIKYRQSWSVFDQIIISDYLLQEDGWYTSFQNATIVNLPFLFENDTKYQGQKLNRTYVGMNYHGGFSDHLPVLLELDR